MLFHRRLHRKGGQTDHCTQTLTWDKRNHLWVEQTCCTDPRSERSVIKKEDALNNRPTDMCPSIITSELNRSLDVNSDTMNSVWHRVQTEVIGSKLAEKSEGVTEAFLFCFDGIHVAARGQYFTMNGKPAAGWWWMNTQMEAGGEMTPWWTADALAG